MAASFQIFDLNLLRVFDAIMEERSVLRASQRLCLTQSAVSHSLARLRELLEDELYVRTTTGMQPTARALAMASMVREALRTLRDAVEAPTFDPAASTRTFTIAASDFVTMVVVPELLSILSREAPGVDLVIRPVTRIDLAEQIDLGRIDVALGNFAYPPDRFTSQILFGYDDVLIADAALPLDTLDCARLAQLPIAVVSFGGERDGAVDGFLFERGLARRSEMYDRKAFEQALAAAGETGRIALSLPHFLALPALLAGSERAAIVPRPLGQSFAGRLPIAVHELPYPTLQTEVRCLWHERNDKDTAQSWLRDVIQRATESLRQP